MGSGALAFLEVPLKVGRPEGTAYPWSGKEEDQELAHWPLKVLHSPGGKREKRSSKIGKEEVAFSAERGGGGAYLPDLWQALNGYSYLLRKSHPPGAVK